VVGTLLAFPNYTAYFNELMDADSSYKTFAGTNNDIGQDLKPLAAYLQEHGLSHVYLSYLGTVPPAYYSINYTYMPSPHFQPWVPEYAPHEEDLPANFSEDCSPKQGIVAISITNLDGLYLSNKSCFDWLTDYSPIAHVGHTIFVYDTSFLQEKQ
jgi:hypothetical protein